MCNRIVKYIDKVFLCKSITVVMDGNESWMIPYVQYGTHDYCASFDCWKLLETGHCDFHILAVVVTQTMYFYKQVTVLSMMLF